MDRRCGVRFCFGADTASLSFTCSILRLAGPKARAVGTHPDGLDWHLDLSPGEVPGRLRVPDFSESGRLVAGVGATRKPTRASQQANSSPRTPGRGGEIGL